MTHCSSFFDTESRKLSNFIAEEHTNIQLQDSVYTKHSMLASRKNINTKLRSTHISTTVTKCLLAKVTLKAKIILISICENK